MEKSICNRCKTCLYRVVDVTLNDDAGGNVSQGPIEAGAVQFNLTRLHVVIAAPECSIILDELSSRAF